MPRANGWSWYVAVTVAFADRRELVRRRPRRVRRGQSARAAPGAPRPVARHDVASDGDGAAGGAQAEDALLDLLGGPGAAGKLPGVGHREPQAPGRPAAP